MDKNKNKPKVKIIAHRGASGLAPENTIAAINKALEYNVDRIEIDVHQTKDNKIVVMHDHTLDRTTNGSGEIKQFTYNDLIKLDAGSWFAPKFKNEKIPLLDDVLKIVNGKSELIIEIKLGSKYYPNIERNIIDVIRKNNALDWCIIHSFDTQILEKIHRIEPNIRLQKILFGKLSFIPIIISNKIEYYDFDKYPFITEYNINYNFANKRIIDKLHKLGKKVNVWTVNNENKINKLINLKIDGIITNYPNLLQ